MREHVMMGQGPHNTSVAAQFRAQKAVLGITFAALEAGTGIKLRQLKYLLHDESALYFEDYVTLCVALELDPVEVMIRTVDL